MGVVTNKRSIMTFYMGVADVLSHRIRIVMAEKGVAYDPVQVDRHTKPEDLLELNPYGTIPTLVDRDLVLYQPNIIMEYLDERFPHPPLMPVYPVARAKARLAMYRMDKEWLPLIQQLETPYTEGDKATAAKELSRYIGQLASHFNTSAYFFGDEFTLIDCCLAPILWRASVWGLNFTERDAKVLNKYKQRLFHRDAFQTSLTQVEADLRSETLVS